MAPANSAQYACIEIGPNKWRGGIVKQGITHLLLVQCRSQREPYSGFSAARKYRSDATVSPTLVRLIFDATTYVPVEMTFSILSDAKICPYILSTKNSSTDELASA